MDYERLEVCINELLIILFGFGFFINVVILLSARMFVFSLVFQGLL